MTSSYRFLWAVFFVLSLFSCKKEAGEGGLASIKGHVSKDIRLVLTNPASYQYSVDAADYDVFIRYGDNVSPDDRVWTNYEGDFEFMNLRKGSYTIYVYSRDTTGISGVDPERMVIKQTVELTERDQELVLPDFVVYDQP
jgi:hypothetical protein